MAVTICWNLGRVRPWPVVFFRRTKTFARPQKNEFVHESEHVSEHNAYLGSRNHIQWYADRGIANDNYLSLPFETLSIVLNVGCKISLIIITK